jgi:hypothetical protein
VIDAKPRPKTIESVRSPRRRPFSEDRSERHGKGPSAGRSPRARGPGSPTATSPRSGEAKPSRAGAPGKTSRAPSTRRPARDASSAKSVRSPRAGSRPSPGKTRRPRGR